ncbi:MAG: purine-nucleoside phosphorylase [candidate division WOR-3 bacterium]|nr:purine-nucleoside phosphorylase [candidate division WOR-3 bacterium]
MSMHQTNIFQKIQESVRFIRSKIDDKPNIGIILGTGLGKLVSDITIKKTIDYTEIPHFLRPTVESHSGRLIFGRLSGKRVVAMQGRFHYYEGYDMADITHPVRVMKELGVKILIVSNASGGLNPQFSVSDIMVITDHINLMGNNPLRGVNDTKLGPRFPDMYNCYDKGLIKLVEAVALKSKIKIQKGVYVAVHGPNLETAAEYRFLRIIGGDAVGMSTVPEVIVARQIGLKVLGLSVITDMGLPDAMQPVAFTHVLAAANKAEPNLTRLIREVVRAIPINELRK